MSQLLHDSSINSRVAYLTAGAAGMFCGSCMRDNAMASALTRMGVDIQLIPTYTPIRTDEESVAIDQVFFGGINVYLQDRYPIFRHLPRWFGWMLDRPWLIRWLAGRGMETSAKDLGSLTLSMLQGIDGSVANEVRRLVDYLKEDLRPGVVGLTNLLIGGCIPTLKEELGVPIVVTLQGDDLFLLDLVEPFRSRSIERLSQIGKDVDAFVTFSNYYADFMADLLHLDRSRFHIIPLGIQASDFEPTTEPVVERLPTLGYFARICPAKGFHHLVDAWLMIRSQPGLEKTKLRAAGWLGGGDQAFFDEQVSRIGQAGAADDFKHIGIVDREGKRTFFQSIDVLSVPTTYREPKGLFVLESLASGVPVVQPAHGAFPELLASTGGGILVPPEQTRSLAEAIAFLLADRSQARMLGDQGRQGVTRAHTSDLSARKILEVFQQVARQ
jgi:glycosyltransferase involved in cell wall biosynthesis